MGKHASIQDSSTIQFGIRLFVLMLSVHAIAVGCRGPWFQKADKFDALVVSEKGEARTPRAFASSRLRPSTEENPRTEAPRPDGRSRAISDDLDEYAVGDDLPSERQEVFRRQMEALKSKRAEGAEDLLAKKGPSANFSISDDGESASFDGDSAASLVQKQVSKNKLAPPADSADPKLSDQPAKQPMTDTKPHPLSRVGERMAGNQKVPGTAPAKAAQPVVQSSTTQPNPSTAQATQASVTAPIEYVEVIPEIKIKIETAKTDWRVLASETLAALRLESDSAVVLSPDQKLSIEAKKRMLSLILDDLEGAMAPIESLQAHEQEFFQHEFQAIFAATDPKGNPVLNRRWTLALQSHRKAQMSLAAVSNLEIQNATFCTEVDSFGLLSKFPQYHFRKDQELLLYCELDNFLSTPVKDGFETQLQGSYEIVDSNGRRVADQLLPMDEHVCRNQRRDYFIAYRMYMPQDIKAGRHTLKLTIEDMKGHKFGQTNVEFQIVQ